MNWQMIRDWLLEAEVITEEQAARLTVIAEQKTRESMEDQARWYRERRAAHAAKPWWRRWLGRAV